MADPSVEASDRQQRKRAHEEKKKKEKWKRLARCACTIFDRLSLSSATLATSPCGYSYICYEEREREGVWKMVVVGRLPSSLI